VESGREDRIVYVVALDANNGSRMSEEPSLQDRLNTDTVRGGAIVTAAALIVGYLTRDTTFDLPVVGSLLLGLVVVWAFLATIARLIFARNAGDALSGSRPIIRWFGARLALFFAAAILFLCWLASLPIGRPWSGIAGRALILVLLISWLTSLIGQGAISSALLVARFRRPK
jgi:hypothetical protein